MDAWMDDPRVISSVRVWKSRHEGASAHGRAGGWAGVRACGPASLRAYWHVRASVSSQFLTAPAPMVDLQETAQF